MFDYQYFISVIMSRKLISAAHSLQLVPVYNIIHFGVVRLESRYPLYRKT